MKAQSTPIKNCILVAVMLFASSGLAQAQYNYTDNSDGTCTITGYTGSGGDLVIPGMIDGLTVSGIGQSAFYDLSSLTSVTLTNRAISIGQEAFSFCNNLTSVTITNCVTSIGAAAFYQCTSLMNVTLGNGISNIDDEAFQFCTNLTKVVIPNGVTNIGIEAFFNCFSLTSVTIPNSVTTIRYQAFLQCFSLTSVTIPYGVHTIELNTFFNCTSLTNATIPGSVTSIDIQAFEGCTSLTSVIIPDSVISIGDQAFAECTAMNNVAIGNGVTNIGPEAFYVCIGLTNFSVSALNPAYSSLDGVLFDKAQATLIQFPASLGGAYSIPNSVTSIGDDAFTSCAGLANVTIPNNVTNIGVFAFRNCGSLGSITMPKKLVIIGTQAFVNCTNLTAAYFQGNAPPDSGFVFSGYPTNDPTIVYYLAGTTGWGPTFGTAPTVLWNPQVQTGDGSFGVQNNQFGFNVAGSSNLVVVVEACTNLTNPVWSPVSTNTLNSFVGTNGTSYFSDPQWTNYTGRFYRFRSP